MTRIISKRALLAFGLLIFTQNCSTNKPIEWHQEEGYKWAELNLPNSGKVGFKQLSESETGILFANNLDRNRINENRILLNGSGVAVGDIDGDGLSDLYFCRLDGPNILYKNLGNWKFRDITDSAGVACPKQYSSGAALADLDGDADLDLLVTAVGGPNTCFLNDGTGKFTDVTEIAGISSETGASTMTLADIDGDNDLDLYISNYKIKSAKDIWDPGELTFNFVVEEIGGTPRIAPKFQDHFVLDIRGKWVLYFETGEPDMLFLNDGSGRFEQVSLTDGRFLNESGEPESELKDWGLMARFQDIDGDGDPDLYVCNDFESPDRIWINDGKGNFQAIAKLAVRKTSNSSMAVDFSDIDRDGDLDIFVSDMLSRYHHRRMTQRTTMVPLPHPIGEIDNRPQYMRNTLFLNRGDNTYAEIAYFGDVQASEWSWSPLFLDVDLDGYEDLIIATGHYYDAQDLDAMMKARNRIRESSMAIQMREDPKQPLDNKLNTIFLYPKLNLRNVAFHNGGDLTFEEVGREWGFSAEDISNAMALGDLDNDGDLDVVTNRLNATAAIYRNESNAPRIAVRLSGLSPNTQGIGAKIRVDGGSLPQYKEVTCAGHYLSSSDPLYVFAAKADNLFIEVKWRSGNVSTINNVKPNRIYDISESNAQSKDNANAIPEPEPQPVFEDVSQLIKHTHHEDLFDDFQRQPLLPKRLSNLGPGITWHDMDSDGDEDLLIGSGKGGQLAYFQNDEQAGFHQVKDSKLSEKTTHDQTTILAWDSGTATTSLLIGSSNFENTEDDDSFLLNYNFQINQANLVNKIAAMKSSIGPMTMADYDGDGDLDLFVGGRSIPGRYPEAASSKLYKNEENNLEPDLLNNEKLNRVGLVSGAVFSDFDGDGDPDLVLAVEWGSMMVFRNEEGQFNDVTQELGLSKYYGFWQGVTTGDIDGDGKLDIIATNWGMNSKYQNRYDNEHPLQIFYHDFDNNGKLDIVEAYFDHPTQSLVPERNLITMMQAMPQIRFRIPDNFKYSHSTLQGIIGPKLKQAGMVMANTLAHLVFFNRGKEFKAVEMPKEAQFSPAFYVGVADYDGDGFEDVFLSQNFFSYEIETPRSDAGSGVWLKGDGSEKLTAVPARESGIKIYGEQRGAALGDYDNDGRVDLVVSQNDAVTKLYHNVGAKPGLRIRLAGPKGNHNGVGATIRLVYDVGYGPAREVHLGSGYWSQDSVVQVMGSRKTPKGIWLRWPGGKITESDIPPDAKEITVKFDGKVLVH